MFKCVTEKCVQQTLVEGWGSVYFALFVGAHSLTLKTPVLDNYHERRISVLHTKL